MKAFLTGATGFVGSHVARRLVSDGAEVHLMARAGSSLWRIEDICDRVTMHAGDVTDHARLKEIAQDVRPDIIFHFANAGVYGGVSATPQQLMGVNGIGLANLLEAFRDIPYRSFVNIGSSSEYGIQESPMRETDSCQPMNAYGITKLAATLAATLEAKSNQKPVATFRLFSPFGPYDDPSRLIMQASRNLSARVPFRMPHPDSVRDYIYIDDAVDLLVQVAPQIEKYPGEVFNLGSGTETHVTDVLAEIARLTGAGDFLATLPPGGGPLGMSESPRWVADMTKTYEAFGWKPKLSVAEGLAITVPWAIAHP